MNGNDGICLAAVTVTGSTKQVTWTGDIGYTCGAQWYQSTVSLGESNKQLRCVWLDANHDNGIIAKALTLHILDFSGDEAILEQYQENQERLCQATARMTFHPDFTPNSLAPTFKPPVTWTSGTGALDRPDQGIDRKTSAYPDGTKLPSGRKLRKRQVRDLVGRQGVHEPDPKNTFAERLTVSHMPGHSAK